MFVNSRFYSCRAILPTKKQFEKLEDKINLKRNIFNRYVDGFKDIKEIEMLVEPANMLSTHWLSIMKIKNSKVKPIDIIETLEKENIEARHIWKPMHLQPVFEHCDFFMHGNEKAICEELFESGVCLPSDTNMTKDEQEKIIKIITKMFK